MKIILFLISLLIITSCANVAITPASCNTTAIWGSSSEQTRHLDARTLSVDTIKINSDKLYFVPFNRTIEISKVLEENNLSCANIKSLRAIIETQFFFYKRLTLIVSLI